MSGHQSDMQSAGALPELLTPSEVAAPSRLLLLVQLID